MRKLVAESIEEALSQKNILNEGVVKDHIKKLYSSLQKVGDMFLSFYKGKILPVLSPINLGILYMNNKLSSAIHIIPSKSDVKMVPALAELRNKQDYLQRKEAEEYKELKKPKGNIAKQYERLKQKKRMNERMVELPNARAVSNPKDIVPDVDTHFIVNRILLSMMDPSVAPPLIWGAIGIGKTSITKAVLRALGGERRLIDVRTSAMSPDDWALPAIQNIESTILKDGRQINIHTIKAKDVPKSWLPVYEVTGDPEEDAKRNDQANMGDGGIIFLDELSRADLNVQNTCLSLVGKKEIGQSVLGDKWIVIAASNRELDDVGQFPINSALSNRFFHCNFVPTVEEWIEWGSRFGNIDPRILTFVEFNREHFYYYDNEVRANTTPRSWEALSYALNVSHKFSNVVFRKKDLDNTIIGFVNYSTYEALIAFLVLIETFHPSEIKMLFTDPKNSPKPMLKSEKNKNKLDISLARGLISAAVSQSKGRVLTAKETENYISYWINLGNNTLTAAALLILVDHHEYINEQIGEEGTDLSKATYKKTMDMFRAAVGRDFSSLNREEVMTALK